LMCDGFFGPSHFAFNGCAAPSRLRLVPRGQVGESRSAAGMSIVKSQAYLYQEPGAFARAPPAGPGNRANRGTTMEYSIGSNSSR